MVCSTISLLKGKIFSKVNQKTTGDSGWKKFLGCFLKEAEGHEVSLKTLTKVKGFRRMILYHYAMMQTFSQNL